MPTTRRSSGARSSSGSGKQSTISFPHRVTKSVPKSAKESAVASFVPKKSALSKSTKPEPEEELEVEPEAVQDIPADEEHAEAEEAEEPPPARSEVELKAEKISNAAIEKYWRNLEAQRKAARVHQEELSTGEKVLRYFDVSSQYGPCVGLTRLKRWQRAEGLGLNPPIEVLAVLLKEEAKGMKGFEKAHIDDILNSTAAGPV